MVGALEGVRGRYGRSVVGALEGVIRCIAERDVAAGGANGPIQRLTTDGLHRGW